MYESEMTGKTLSFNKNQKIQDKRRVKGEKKRGTPNVRVAEVHRF
jgi:hypothetical protein